MINVTESVVNVAKNPYNGLVFITLRGETDPMWMHSPRTSRTFDTEVEIQGISNGSVRKVDKSIIPE